MDDDKLDIKDWLAILILANEQAPMKRVSQSSEQLQGSREIVSVANLSRLPEECCIYL